jgi:hypothetical protein
MPISVLSMQLNNNKKEIYMSNQVINLFGPNGQPVSSTQEPKPVKIVEPFYADSAHANVSIRYNQVKTIAVAEALQDTGWEIVKTASSRVRDTTREGFQKHMVWMKPKGGSGKQLTVGDTEMRLVIVNSHDGTSAFKMSAGLHRLVCSNGLMVCTGDLEAISIRHTEAEIEELAIDGAYRIAAMAPKIDQVIKTMQDMELNPDQQIEMAQQAIDIVWDRKDYVHPAALLRARRFEDDKPTLWNVFNNIQENLIRGGLSTSTGRNTRRVSSPARDIEINKALFSLAMKKAA